MQFAIEGTIKLPLCSVPLQFHESYRDNLELEIYIYPILSPILLFQFSPIHKSAAAELEIIL